MSPAYDKIVSLLDASGCRYTVHRHVAVISVADALTQVPELTHNLTKTIVFRKRNGAWLLAALRHDDRVDYKKLAAAVGVNRKELRSVAPADIEAELGFEIGGVGPFPVSEETEVVIDSAVREFATTVCGSGKNTCSLELAVDDLIRVTNAAIAPLARSDERHD